MPVFFKATQNALEQFTELYNFFWPSISAVWNMRWQIQGFVNEVGIGNISDTDLQKRFDWGSNLHGVNLRVIYLEETWETQREKFAKILLINLISIYEGWLADIQTILQFDKPISDSLQFPTTYDVNGEPTHGVKFGVQRICQIQSVTLMNAFYTGLRNDRKYSWNNIDNLLKCFRFFKESRNCIAHHGGRVDRRLADAYQAFQPIATPNDLGLAEVPFHTPAIINEPVYLDLRGVVGLGDVLIKMMTTLDAELSISQHAEVDLIERCRVWANQHPRELSFPHNQNSRDRRTKSVLKACGYPIANNVEDIYQLLLSTGIIH